MAKTYKQYENEVRSAHPEWTSEQVAAEAKKIYQASPESTYKKSSVPKPTATPTPTPSPTSTQTTSGARPQFDPNLDSGGAESDQQMGIDLGFGTSASLVPLKYETYITTLAATNKKAFSAIKDLVKNASGRNIQDPTTLGKWISRYATAMRASTDPMVQTLSIEDMLRNSAAAKFTQSQANIPSRQVYQYTPEQKLAVINKGAQSLIGRELNDEDKKQSWYSELSSAIQSMMDAGTVTATKTQKNPKTGKLEKVTVSTPSYSEEKALGKVESTLKGAAELTDDIQRKRESDFGNWIFKQIGGN